MNNNNNINNKEDNNADNIMYSIFGYKYNESEQNDINDNEFLNEIESIRTNSNNSKNAIFKSIKQPKNKYTLLNKKQSNPINRLTGKTIRLKYDEYDEDEVIATISDMKDVQNITFEPENDCFIVNFNSPKQIRSNLRYTVNGYTPEITKVDLRYKNTNSIYSKQSVKNANIKNNNIINNENSENLLDNLTEGNLNNSDTKNSIMNQLQLFNKNSEKILDNVSEINSIDTAKKNNNHWQKRILFNSTCASETTKNLVDSGIIGFLQISNCIKSKTLYEALLNEQNISDKAIFTGKLISNWPTLDLNANFKVKKRHLWIYSKFSNRGKSTFGYYVMDKFKTAVWVKRKGFDGSIKYADIVLFDEFCPGMISKEDLCNLCGGMYALNNKFNDPICAQNVKLVIILSNFAPESCFSVFKPGVGDSEYDFILSRFRVFCVDDVNEWDERLADYVK